MVFEFDRAFWVGQPPIYHWRLWVEIDTEEKEDCENEGGTGFKPPGNVPNPSQHQIDAKAEEGAEGGPHLPTHNKATSNRGGGVSGGKNWDHGRFGAHTDPEQQTAGEKSFPGLGEAGTG